MPGFERWVLAVVLVMFPGGARAAGGGPGTPSSYADSILTWRADREKRLSSDTGWLTVAGLFWLESGDNSFGTAADNRIVLPAGAAPEHAGVLRLDPAGGGKVTLHADPDAGITVDGKPVTEQPLASDDSGKPDIVSAGRLSLFVIRRGDHLALRMRDPESALRRSFRGLEYFAIDPAWRVEAEFVPFDPPRMIPVPNILGYADSMQAPGRLAFTLRGTRCTLTPVREDPADTTLFIIFRDATTDSETYGGGRFLYAEAPKNGRVILDFNKAYNPPCALTPFTTCPMPPEGNDLAVAVRAGEKRYRGDEEDALRRHVPRGR